MGYCIYALYIFIGLRGLTKYVIVLGRQETLEAHTMSTLKRFRRVVGIKENGVRKEATRSTLRRQLFNERQLTAMQKWQQIAVVAWK
jgi:hypothetical protein